MSADNRIAQAALFLLEEHRTRQPFGPIPAACAARTVDEAYAVQEAFHALMAATHGPVAGYKIALTTPVMQHMVGFHEPVSGAILAKTMQQSSCTIRSTDYGRLGVECEIAVRLAADLPVTPAPYSREQITAAIDYIRGGLSRGERCLYVCGEQTPDEFRAELRAAGIEHVAEEKRGALVLTARVSNRARPGVVVALSIWWRKLSPDGTNANMVTGQGLTDLGRAATFYDCLVEVARVPNP